MSKLKCAFASDFTVSHSHITNTITTLRTSKVTYYGNQQRKIKLFGRFTAAVGVLRGVAMPGGCITVTCRSANDKVNDDGELEDAFLAAMN